MFIICIKNLKEEESYDTPGIGPTLNRRSSLSYDFNDTQSSMSHHYSGPPYDPSRETSFEGNGGFDESVSQLFLPVRILFNNSFFILTLEFLLFYFSPFFFFYNYESRSTLMLFFRQQMTPLSNSAVCIVTP